MGKPASASALATLHSYIYKIRKGVFDVVDGGRVSLHTKPNGYQLDMPTDALDAHRFDELVGLGQKALDGGDARTAAGVLGRAGGHAAAPAGGRGNRPSARRPDRALPERRCAP
ncbi:hypothetical protein SFUMM280S_05826 [Streptomyces fumanus]